MKIELTNIKIRDLFNGYKNNNEEGVVAYNGLLNVRPSYQREFIYKDSQRDAVIDTVMKGFPLNVMYWSKSGQNENGETTYELLDGQQRTLSICGYLNKDFSIKYRFIHNLTEEEKEKLLNYELQVYICEGTELEKLEWFKTINIAGEKLTNQELLNAIYTGEWLNKAKLYFSKPNCIAYNKAKDYIKGTPIRQDYLETVLSWIANRDGLNCGAEYMATHQKDKNINDIKLYFENVISWIETIFPNYRKEMKGLQWGMLYNKYKDNNLDPEEVEKEIKELMIDDDVTKKNGVYEYLLSNKTLEKTLSIRKFTDKQKRQSYEKQNGICPLYKNKFDIKDMEADHITPWSKGGTTTIDNLQMICKNCNRTKSNK